MNGYDEYQADPSSPSIVAWVFEDAEEDALLVKQHDDKGRDIDALPYTDDDPVEHTE